MLAPPATRPAPARFHRPVLVVIFLLGLYLGVSLAVSAKVPLTCAPSGFAGLIMLWRRRDQIVPKHLAGLLLVVTVYLCSVLAASDYSFLGKRFTGLLQLTYSLVIAYAMFLTLLQGDRRQIARILLIFCLAIIVGCLLEQYGGLRRLSDAVRERLYQMDQVYDADLRDQVLYGRVRPKLFTSEPSAVTFAYTHFSSVWLVISPWRYKLLVYFGLIALGAGRAAGPHPGPDGVPERPLPGLPGRHPAGRPHLGLADGRHAVPRGRARRGGRRVRQHLLRRAPERAGNRPRRQLLLSLHRPDAGGLRHVPHHPWAGAGLTGEPFITNNVHERLHELAVVPGGLAHQPQSPTC